MPGSGDMHLLHRATSRAEIYCALAPVRRLPDVKVLAVVDPELIAMVLSSAEFRVPNFAVDYQAVSAHTRIDFSAIIAAFDHIPLANEGSTHKKLRKQMAGIISARAPQAEAQLRGDVDHFMASLLVAGKTVDFLSDIALPTYRSLFGSLLGIDAQRTDVAQDASQMFYPLLSLNRRKQLDRCLRQALVSLTENGKGLATTEEIALAMVILGRDTLVGTLALSLWHEVALNPGRRLNEITFGEMPGSTSLAFVERVAAEDTMVGAVAVSKGERVRLFLDATTVETLGHDAGLMFGKGRHLCLGRGLALAAWHCVTQALSRSQLKALPMALGLRGSDYVFNYPDYARIELRS